MSYVGVNALISKSNTSKKILDILFLGYKKAIRGRRDFNPKKVAKRSKIRHKKLLTKTSLYKGNILRVVASDDHVINIEKKKSPTTRRRVNKQRGNMITRAAVTTEAKRSNQVRGAYLRPWREHRSLQTIPSGA